MSKYLEESQIIDNVQKEMMMYNFFWNAKATQATINVMYKGLALFLSRKKSKDKPVAAMIVDDNDGFHFGAICEFQKAEEAGGDEGSWSLGFTYDKNDIDPSTMDIYVSKESQELKSAFVDAGYTEGVTFKYPNLKDSDKKEEETRIATPDMLMNICADSIKNYMRANVTIDPVLIIKGMAKLTAVADANTNDVIVGIEPEAELRQIIQDDSSIDNN